VWADNLKVVLVAGVIVAHATIAWTGVGNRVLTEPPVREPPFSVLVLASGVGVLFGMASFFLRVPRPAAVRSGVGVVPRGAGRRRGDDVRGPVARDRPAVVAAVVGVGAMGDGGGARAIEAGGSGHSRVDTRERVRPLSPVGGKMVAWLNPSSTGRSTPTRTSTASSGCVTALLAAGWRGTSGPGASTTRCFGLILPVAMP